MTETKLITQDFDIGDGTNEFRDARKFAEAILAFLDKDKTIDWKITYVAGYDRIDEGYIEIASRVPLTEEEIEYHKRVAVKKLSDTIEMLEAQIGDARAKLAHQEELLAQTKAAI